MNKLAIGHRLSVGFIAVIVACLAVAGVAVLRVGEINAHLTTINDLNSVKQRYAIDFRGSVHDRAIALRDVVLAPTPAHARPEVELIRSLEDDYAASAELMDEVFADPAKASAAEREALAEIQRIEAETMPLIEEVIDLHTAGDRERARTTLNVRAKPLFTDWLAAINVFIDMQEEMNDAETAQARGTADTFWLLMLVLCGAAASVATVIGVTIKRSITRPLAQTVDVLGAVADGDLTRRLDVRSRDEMGQMATSLNATLDELHDLLEGIAERAEGLATTSDEVSTLASDVADGAMRTSTESDVAATAAREVSANVATIAAGSTQMGQAIAGVARSAGEAATVASRAVDAAEGATATITRLGESSRLIGDIVRTITTIAEQTNLLALNATIEAARAGEAGRGFAVVANEVKELAQETARATEDIARRVEAIQADSASAVDSITEVSDIITEMNAHGLTIASAVEEQSATAAEMNRGIAEASAGTEQIATSIAGVAEVAGHGSEAVEHFQAAADTLARVSGELQELVTRFRF